MYLSYVVSNKDQVYIVIWNNTRDNSRDNSNIKKAATSQAICWAKHVVTMSVDDFPFISFICFTVTHIT